VQHAITNAEELARKYGYQVADNGAVADTFPEGKAPPEMNPDDRARVRTEVADAIAQALRTADDIDNDLTSVLKRAETGDFGTGDESTVAAAADGAKDPGLTLLEPPKDGTAAQNAGWWNSLSPAGQAILLRDHPDWLGNLDGIPGATRSAANLARIPGERADLERQRAAAQAVVNQAKGVYDPTGNTMINALRQLDKIEWSDRDPVPHLDIANNFGVSPYEGISGGTLSDINQLSTGDASGAGGQPLHATHQHGEYLDNNSTSQYNMSSVVAGRPDLTVRHVQPWEVPSPPPTPGQPIPAPPGRDPQPSPLPR
jgi:hypothetical protein